MAITTVIGTPAQGVNYTVTTDTSADWSAVANDTYFYELADKLVHYKNSSGDIIEGFSGGNNFASTQWGATASNVSLTNGQIANGMTFFTSANSGPV